MYLKMYKPPLYFTDSCIIIQKQVFHGRILVYPRKTNSFTLNSISYEITYRGIDCVPQNLEFISFRWMEEIFRKRECDPQHCVNIHIYLCI